MRLIIVLLTVVVTVHSNVISQKPNGVYNYHNTIGVPEADRIRKLEKELIKTDQRVSGGSSTISSAVPYQVNLNDNCKQYY